MSVGSLLTKFALPVGLLTMADHALRLELS